MKCRGPCQPLAGGMRLAAGATGRGACVDCRVGGRMAPGVGEGVATAVSAMCRIASTGSATGQGRGVGEASCCRAGRRGAATARRQPVWCRVVMSFWAGARSSSSPSETTVSSRRLRPWRRSSSWSASLTASLKAWWCRRRRRHVEHLGGPGCRGGDEQGRGRPKAMVVVTAWLRWAAWARIHAADDIGRGVALSWSRTRRPGRPRCRVGLCGGGVVRRCHGAVVGMAPAARWAWAVIACPGA